MAAGVLAVETLLCNHSTSASRQLLAEPLHGYSGCWHDRGLGHAEAVAAVYVALLAEHRQRISSWRPLAGAGHVRLGHALAQGREVLHHPGMGAGGLPARQCPGRIRHPAGPAHTGELPGRRLFAWWRLSMAWERGRLARWRCGHARHALQVSTCLEAHRLDVAHNRSLRAPQGGHSPQVGVKWQGEGDHLES